jgi:serine protease
VGNFELKKKLHCRPHRRTFMRLELAVSLACSLALVVMTPVAALETDLQRPTRILVSYENVASQQSATEAAKKLINKDWQRQKRGTDELWTGYFDSAAELQSTLNAFVAEGARYAVLDERRHRHAVPSDPIFTEQWYLQAAQPAAIAATAAWDITTGSNAVVVAVLDTGVRFDHPDLLRVAQAGKLLPGYDFIAADSGGAFATANDGDGRDADPSDPGDWVDGNDIQQPRFRDCDLDNSSWHGTRVSAMIGALTDNGVGVAGVGWNTRILPVRVLGKCGGFDSDIIDAMRWAAGLPVSGVPNNPNPARIINMSLGSEGVCNIAYFSAIQQLTAMGVSIVISGGNSGGPTDSPANCPGAIGVVGLRHIGTKVGFSSLGPEIAIAAPAGNCVNLSGPCLFSLHTAVDSGTTVPAGTTYTDQFNTNLGTSFSAPLVAGTIALMQAVHPQLSADGIRARLREGATAFPPPGDGIPICHAPANLTDLQTSECGCTSAVCGAGMLNANGAVRAAQRPVAVAAANSAVAAGSAATLAGSGSHAAINRTIVSFAWGLASACGTSAPTLTVVNQPTLIVSAPRTGSITLQLTVTDSQNATDSTYISLAGSAATASAQIPTCTFTSPPPSSGGGGGGSLQVGWLLLLGIAAVRRQSRLAPNEL